MAAWLMKASPPPILVTGMPRSGTTWVARQLAQARGTSLPGREPMNPRDSQYGLGGTVTGWTRLEQPTDKQRLFLRMAYAGLDPRIFSKYGHRQWAAALPWARVIVKDPFALISLPAVVEATGALPVVVYRHPGAVLASFRRMSWVPDPDEVAHLESMVPDRLRRTEALVGAPVDVELIGRMWSALYSLVLMDAEHLQNLLCVSHGDLVEGGPEALSTMFVKCRLPPASKPRHTGHRRSASTTESRQLHNFDRDPREVASSWRSKVSHDDVAYLEEAVEPVWTGLQDRRLRLEPVGE